jgi:hypothetical protein
VLLETVRTRHGTSPEARRAEAAEAAPAVDGEAVRDTVVTPRRTGTGSGTGQARVVVTNAASDPLRLVLSGSDAGRVLEIGACQRCPHARAVPLDADAVARCDTGKGRTVVVTLPSGTYLVHASRPAVGRIGRWTGTWELRSGSYAPCF